MAQFDLANFDSTPGDALSLSYVDETGNTWPVFGPGGFASLVFVGAGDAVYAPGHSYSNYVTGVPASADYSATGVISVYQNDGNICGVCVRMQYASFGYARYEAYTNGTTWTLSAFNSVNAETSLGTYSQTLADGTDYTAKLEAIGTAIKFYVDGVQRISVTDSIVATAGRAGIRGDIGTGSANYKHFSSFHADDVASAPTIGHGNASR